MNKKFPETVTPLYSAIAALAIAATAGPVLATEPCGDFGECKVLIEINASDGDIGFHFLMDGDDLVEVKMRDPDKKMVFKDKALGPLREQTLTETFAESAEPLCWEDPEADEDDDIVTLADFLDLWSAGTYRFIGKDKDGEKSNGETQLSHALPAAPADVDYDGGVISWAAGDDLGECASFGDLSVLVSDGVLPAHPEDVPVASWEVVLEPDVEDGDPTDALVYTIRVPGHISTTAVSVPREYLDALPEDTPVKVEVGAIGVDDNATFSEEDGFCVNENEGCEEEDE